MLKAAGCDKFIPKGDTMASRIKDRVEVVESNLTRLLEATCSSIALSLDG
jgi:hypothetical protein